jgi:predicted nucleotide-binding protein (sugar kinase/HSP70/actin superfamily)
MILALTHHIPFIGISYSQKTNMLLGEIDWKYSHAGNEKTDDILENINTIESHYEELKKSLELHHTGYKTAYNNFFP